MIEAFLHGLGWCLGAVVALLIYVAVVPLVRKPREFDAERTNKRSLELLAERNDLTRETNGHLLEIVEYVKGAMTVEVDPNIGRIDLSTLDLNDAPDPPNPSDREVIHGA